MTQWIPCSERLPPEDHDASLGDWYTQSIKVLATDGNWISVAYCKTADDHTEWYQQGRDGYFFDDVTHWMPLPNLP